MGRGEGHTSGEPSLGVVSRSRREDRNVKSAARMPHFTGFDYHPASIDRARNAAANAGVAANTSFEAAQTEIYSGTYDLVALFDCLHDMGDPVDASAHVRESLKPDGT